MADDDRARLHDRIRDAIDNPGSVVPGDSQETMARWTTRAVMAVLDDEDAQARADDQAFIERQLAETGFAGIDIEDGGMAVRLVIAQATAVHLCEAFAAQLDAAGAVNYIEQEVFDRVTGAGKYRFIVVRPDRPGPHELRIAAERRAEQAEARLAELEGDGRG